MAKAKQSRKRADLRRKHAKQLKKLAKAQARLANASRKLQELDAALARRAQLDHATRDQSAAGDIPLRQALLIFNPRAKGVQKLGNSLDRILGCLHTYGISATVGIKTSGKAARAFARQAVEQRYDLLIVAAGDGTIEDVAGELVGSDTALGILPLGTMNNIARSLGVPLELEPACALLGVGATRRVDLGRVRAPGSPDDAFFLESAGVGLSALAVPLGQDGEKGYWGRLVRHLGAALVHQAADVDVTCDDGAPVLVHTQVITVSNAPLFGKNMLIQPDARMDDGLLDVALYDGMSKRELEQHFVAIADSRRVFDARVGHWRARRVRITSALPLPANADLKVLEERPAWEFEVLPGALTVAVGQGMALAVPLGLPEQAQPALASS
ncbi:MAG TPA: diacylglycerol kinase family protein [Kouleothrix sp.]|uniref:diacylglycerol/lipid kinase family protein n=1 Tax=Kouleothrix sp. TaxID=2779161 RepID=UPI002C3491CD|nr:diacylglycerol kinase family protein [Kouleothrix sp.]